MGKIKKAYNLEEYNKAIEELYSHKRYSRYQDIENDTSEFIGVDWEITNLEELKDPKLKEIVQPSILEEVIELFGEYCKDKHSIEYEGFLKGLLVTEEDNYWILEDAGEKHYLTCVGGIECKYPNTN
jgi:hypothetical protein